MQNTKCERMRIHADMQVIVTENCVELTFGNSPLNSALRFHFSRVVKCQIFYTEQNLQTKFYPKKSA